MFLRTKEVLGYDSVPFPTWRVPKPRPAMDAAHEPEPAERRNLMAMMARLASRMTPEEWSDMHKSLRALSGETEAEDEDDPLGLAAKPDDRVTDLPIFEGLDPVNRPGALDGLALDTARGAKKYLARLDGMVLGTVADVDAFTRDTLARISAV